MPQFKFLKPEKGGYSVDCERLEAYIPKEYMSGEPELAVLEGKTLRTIGIFAFKAFFSKEWKLYSLGVPMDVVLAVHSNREETALSLSRKSEPDDYLVLSYSRGETFLPNDNVIVNDVSIRKFIRLLNSGKLPQGLEYSGLVQLYHNAMEASGVNLGVQSLLLELTLSELCRDSKDPDRPFRLRAGRPDAGEDGYRMHSIMKIPQLSSTFAALAFQDVNESIVSSIRRTRLGKEERESPIEKTIRY